MNTTGPAFLVLSHKHHLTPFAWRLQREGHRVESMCFKPRYEKAWSGAMTSVLSQTSHRPHKVAEFEAELAPIVAQIEAGEIIVLHDHAKWGAAVPNAQFPTLPPVGETTPVRLGGWFDGEKMTASHLIVEDMGAWVGGFGPAVVGGLTLVRPNRWPAAFEQTLQEPVDALKSAGFKGLVGVSLQLSIEDGVGVVGSPDKAGWYAGWHGFHGHAFLAALGTEGVLLGKVLTGTPPVLAHRFSVVAPVTVPPWPYEVNMASHEVALAELPVAMQRELFFHDVRVDMEKRELWVAGLDGLVAVARGCADSWELALARVRQVAGAVQVPERQWRPDVGHGVGSVLAALETVGLGVV